MYTTDTKLIRMPYVI